VGEPVHGVCGACGSGVTVEDGLIVGRDDADLVAALEEIDNATGWAGLGDTVAVHIHNIARAAIAKARGEV